MKLAWLVWKQLLHRPWSAVLSVFLVALSIALISLILHVSKAYETKMNAAIKGIDMVVGAKGSPLQLVLSSVYHVDVPTGNIKLKEMKKIAKHPLVKSTIPLAYGDSYRGFRIVGTTVNYQSLYKAKLKEGRNPRENAMEVVLGHLVAKQTGLKIGSTFSGSHGLVNGGDEHHDHPFSVVGILEQSSAPLNKLILTDISTVHHVHAHDGDVSDEITAMIVRFRNPIALMQLPRFVNTSTNMQAAVPRYEMERLFKIFGAGSKALSGLIILLILVAAMSMLIGLFASLRERIPELALMRAYGASRSRILWMIMLEGGFVAMLGSLLGLVLVRVLVFVVERTWNAASGLLSLSPEPMLSELFLVVACVLLGILIAAVPAMRVLGNKLDPINQ